MIVIKQGNSETIQCKAICELASKARTKQWQLEPLDSITPENKSM